MARTFTVTTPGGQLPTLSTKRRKPGHKIGGQQAELISAYKNYRWTSRLRALFAVVNYALVHGGMLPVLAEHMSIPTTVTLTTATITTTPTSSSQCPRRGTPTCSNTGTHVHSDKPAQALYMRSRTRAIPCTKARLTPDVDTETVSPKSFTIIQSGRVLRPRKLDRNYKV